MKKVLILFSLFVATAMFAQQEGTVKGFILDQEMGNEPLMFANLELKGASITTQSNLFGKFEMSDVAVGNYTLEISNAGYKTIELQIEVKANEVTEIQQILAAEKLSLEDLMMVTENSINVDNLNTSLAKSERE